MGYEYTNKQITDLQKVLFQIISTNECNKLIAISL